MQKTSVHLMNKNKTDFEVIVETPQIILKDVLNEIKKNGGKVQNLALKDGKCSFVLKGLHPEKIFKDLFCTVSYVNGIPRFSIFINAKGICNEKIC